MAGGGLQQPIRVLHAVKGLDLGGAEKAMELMVSGLDRTRFDPLVFSFKDGPRRRRLQQEGVPVHVGGDFHAALSRIRPHIVHLHRAGWPEPALLRPLNGTKRPMVVETNIFGRFDGHPSARVVDRILFVSRFCLGRYCLFNKKNPDDPRLQVVYNPVRADRFAGAHTDDRSRGGVVGRLSRADDGKWSAMSLDMLPRLKELAPHVRWKVIGATQQVRDFVRRRGLSAMADFVEPTVSDAELAEFLDSLDVFLHGNDAGESFGMAIAEAMAAGLPVVTHPSAGFRDNAQLELVEHGVTGIVARTADDYAYAAAKLLRDLDLARAMGRAGRKKAVELYDRSVIVRQIETIYSELAKEAAIDDHGRPSCIQRVHQGGPELSLGRSRGAV